MIVMFAERGIGFSKNDKQESVNRALVAEDGIFEFH